MVTARVPNDGAAALNQRVQDLDARLLPLRNEFPEFEFTVTGSVVAASRNMNAIIIDLARSLALAAGLVFLVFAVRVSLAENRSIERDTECVSTAGLGSRFDVVGVSIANHDGHDVFALFGLGRGRHDARVDSLSCRQTPRE